MRQMIDQDDVSIHALARRATSPSWAKPRTIQSFNSCPRTEGNTQSVQATAAATVFQFMPSHGGQPLKGKGDPGMIKVSIHALARRATVKPERKLCDECVSIHALARRATTLWEFNIFIRMFQFMPSHGGQLSISMEQGSLVLFQFMPSHGGQRN